MTIDSLSSNERVLEELGRRIKAARIDTPLTQEELAERAGISLSTIAAIERGADARMASYLCVLRALNMLENANAFVPEQPVRPTQLAKLGRERKRATSPTRRKDSNDAWAWGDER